MAAGRGAREDLVNAGLAGDNARVMTRALLRIAIPVLAVSVALARASGWFDEIWLDARPEIWQVGGWRALGRRLRAGRFGRVYDLQTSDRSGWYFRLFGADKPQPQVPPAFLEGGCTPF